MRLTYKKQITTHSSISAIWDKIRGITSFYDISVSGNAIKAFDTPKKYVGKNPVTSVILHEDGTVSVGISGAADGNVVYGKDFANKLQSALNESAGYNKYNVSHITDEALKAQIPNAVGNGNLPGVCAEPKAVTAAHYNESPIIGMDTRYYNEIGNPHYFEGASSLNQMEACDTCKAYWRVYINYANRK
ncbi:hypothetical protein [Acetivibrio cellulolyticus]|uniref:hypothetical protein n=1 Tax=Acetivibrio cellulolyticus TaxID=35830 RepID=UPI0001E2F101|nr:hypothetical protein [Acetivibrio cellulolyticus]